MRFILLTGLSGAGKTASLRYLEDMGCLYVDNLPPAMVLRFIELCAQTSQRVKTVVLAVDIRSGTLFDAHALRNIVAGAHTTGTDIRVLFLEASDEALLNRFKETRREHPLQAQATDLSAAIRIERERLQPLRELADVIVDTTGLRVAELREKLFGMLYAKEEAPQLRVEIVSFGFKRGVPRDADIVLDVRFLPNPFYIDDIRFQTGLQSGVSEYVLGAPVTQEFLTRAIDLLTFLRPHYQEEGKKRLVVAIGCTGGAHRSVAIAESLAEKLRAGGCQASAKHRDIELEKENWSHL